MRRRDGHSQARTWSALPIPSASHSRAGQPGSRASRTATSGAHSPASTAHTGRSRALAQAGQLRPVRRRRRRRRLGADRLCRRHPDRSLLPLRPARPCLESSGCGPDGGRHQRLLDLNQRVAIAHRPDRTDPPHPPGPARRRQHRRRRRLATASGQRAPHRRAHGQERTLHTGPLRLGGFQHDLAAGDGALWALDHGNRSHTRLQRFDLQTGRSTATLDVPGIADALIVNPPQSGSPP